MSSRGSCLLACIGAFLVADGASADTPPETITGYVWSEDCALPGIEKPVVWRVFREDEQCDEFMGIGRVVSTCFAAKWESIGEKRWRLLIGDVGEPHEIWLAAPDRLKIERLRDTGPGDTLIHGPASLVPETGKSEYECDGRSSPK